MGTLLNGSNFDFNMSKTTYITKPNFDSCNYFFKEPIKVFINAFIVGEFVFFLLIFFISRAKNNMPEKIKFRLYFICYMMKMLEYAMLIFLYLSVFTKLS